MAFYTTHRALLNVTGSEAKNFLNRVITCRTDDLTKGGVRYGALLTPQGKILTDLFVYDLGDKLILDLPVSTRDDIRKRLTMLKLRADVHLTDAPELFVFATDESNVVSDGLIGEYSDPRTENNLKRILTVSPVTESNAADEDWDKFRFENLIPECGLDYGPSMCFPADVNMDLGTAIDFKKGCFVGQEVASRMKRKTEVRKRTVFLQAETTASVGDEVKAGESTVGEVMNWQANTGLALMRLDRLASAIGKGFNPSLNGASVEFKLPISVVLPEND
jgi:folate-binding protein YgfZ